METRDQIIKELHTLRDYLRWAVTQFTRNRLFFGHGTDNAYDEALYLILHTLQIPYENSAQLLDARLTGDERKMVMTVLETRIKQRIPAPYLTGEAWFCGLRFKVDERVLIPRSPIAELIEQGFEPWLGGRPVTRILDLCTGGGCIGIAAAHYFEEAQVDLSDLSADALAVARYNIEAFELQHRVHAVQSDLFDNLGQSRYDIIVSNPPYVDSDDLDSMPQEFHHEPAMALGSGDDGLDITRRILREAADRLNPEGLLVVEVGNSCVALDAAFPEVPFTWVEFERGGHGVFVMSREQLLHYADQFA